MSVFLQKRIHVFFKPILHEEAILRVADYSSTLLLVFTIRNHQKHSDRLLHERSIVCKVFKHSQHDLQHFHRIEIRRVYASTLAQIATSRY